MGGAVSNERGIPIPPCARHQGGVPERRESGVGSYRGTSLIRKRPPSQTHQRGLCIVLLQGPRKALFLVSEAPL